MYIVYRNELGYATVGAWTEQRYSENVSDAYKYDKIAVAVNLLGLNTSHSILTLDDFYSLNKEDWSTRRDNLISDLLEMDSFTYSFKIGKIYKVDDDGELVSASHDIEQYIRGVIIKRNIERYRRAINFQNKKLQK